MRGFDEGIAIKMHIVHDGFRDEHTVLSCEGLSNQNVVEIVFKVLSFEVHEVRVIVFAWYGQVAVCRYLIVVFGNLVAEMSAACVDDKP